MTTSAILLAGTIIGLVMTSERDFAQSAYEPYTFKTIAGAPGGAGIADGSGSTARFSEPWSVAVDSGGNVYVADTGNNTIRKVTPGGLVTTLAGLAGQRGSADGKGSAARFNGPFGVAVDAAGNVYVADTFNAMVRKVTPEGVVTTLAGQVGQGGSVDGERTAARFNVIDSVAVDRSDNVYVTDGADDTIRKITPAGVVTTLAGLATVSGTNDGTGSAARFGNMFGGPAGIAVDAAGNLYVADERNQIIRKVTATGVVTTLAGVAGSEGTNDGPANVARFHDPKGVAVDGSGNVYVADFNNHTIRKVTPAGVVTTLAGLAGSLGFADGKGSAARFGAVPSFGPSGVAVCADGTIFVADTGNHEIRKITPEGVVTTLAGLAGAQGSKDAAGTVARFSAPGGAAMDKDGNLYVADIGNQLIRKMTPDGVVTTLAGSAGQRGSADGIGSEARFTDPFDVAVDNAGNVFVADTGNKTIRKVTPEGVVTTLAGLAGHPGSADGTGSAARFGGEPEMGGPAGVAVDSAGNVYVADTDNQTIRKITPAGVVTTLAGNASQLGVTGRISGGSEDGTGPVAQFNYPWGITVDKTGTVYVADSQNNSIRKVTPEGTVTTLAGVSDFMNRGSADGTKTQAQFWGPEGVAVDDAGNVYVADTGNRTIRKVTPKGAVTTLAGQPGSNGHADGTGSMARFYPSGVAVDSAGNLYVVDSDSSTILKGFPASSGSHLATNQHGAQMAPTNSFEQIKAKAEAGDLEAQDAVGEALLIGGLGAAKDEAEAVKWFRKAAEQGNAKAQGDLGLCYAKAQGVATNYTEAVKWFRKAAEQGEANGEYLLGVSYALGNGVVEDEVEAVRWFRRAAEQGDAKAQNRLGACYAKGSGVTKNSVKAANWFREAAEQGDANGESNLGLSYERGDGVGKDYVEAYKWTLLGADQGQQAAKAALAGLEALMSPEQAAEGKKLAQDFKPRRVPPPGDDASAAGR